MPPLQGRFLLGDFYDANRSGAMGSVRGTRAERRTGSADGTHGTLGTSRIIPGQKETALVFPGLGPDRRVQWMSRRTGCWRLTRDRPPSENARSRAWTPPRQRNSALGAETRSMRPFRG